MLQGARNPSSISAFTILAVPSAFSSINGPSFGKMVPTVGGFTGKPQNMENHLCCGGHRCQEKSIPQEPALVKLPEMEGAHDLRRSKRRTRSVMNNLISKTHNRSNRHAMES